MTALPLILALLVTEPAPAPQGGDAATALAFCDRPLGSRVLVGCDEDCRVRPQLLALLELAPLGEPPDLATLAARIEDARLTRKASLSCSAEPGAPERSRLTLSAHPIPFVRRVRVTGNDAFRRRELVKRIFLRAGTPIDIDPERPLDNELVRRQIDSLERFYRQSGLDEATASVIVTPVETHLLDLEFRVAEGRRTRLDGLDIGHIHRGLRDPPEVDGDGLACPTISERRLERLIGLSTGDIWTRVVERKVREKLRGAFQAAGYERPRILITPPAGESGPLVIRVETERCWLVRLWERELPGRARNETLSFRWTDPLHAGETPTAAPYTRVPLESWSRSLPFGESGSFDRDEATRGVTQLAEALRARGFPFAEVAVQHRDLSRDELRRSAEPEVMGTIDYLITRNLERRLHGVRLVGRESLPEKELLGLMKTAPYDFFGGSGAIDDARILSDLATLAAHYRDRGFYSFRFVPPRARSLEHLLYRRGDEGRPYALEKHPTSPHLELVIAFEEGPRTELGPVRFTGATLASQEALQKLTGLRPGLGFGPTPLKNGLEKLARFYRQRGHHRLEVKPICRVDGLEVPCDGESVAVPGEVELEVEVREGPVVTVGAVVWRGNAETDPHVLTRDLPEPGEVLDFDKVNAAVRKMRALSTFNSVRVDAEGLDAPTRPEDTSPSPGPARAVLVVAVEETESRFVDLALGLRSIRRANVGRVPAWAASGAGALVDQADRLTTGFGRAFPLDIPDLLLTFDFEYVDLNSRGIGNQLRIPFDAGFSLSQFLRQASFNPSYTFPRVLDSDLKLVLRMVAELDRVTDPLDRLELGIEGDLLVPLTDQMLAGVSSRVGVIQLERPDDDCVYCLTGPPIGLGTTVPQIGAEAAADEVACDGDPNAAGCADAGFRPQLTTSLRWRLDTQDTPLHPTRGVLLSAVTSFILDRDRLSSAPVFNQFLKWEVSARAALSLQSLVFAAFLRYGGSATFGEPFLPPDERFTLGGSNGMRGFTDNGICRYDKDGALESDCPTEFGGNVIVQGSLELRAPLFPSAGIWLGAFMDVGGLARSHEELHLASLRMAAGFGLRWLIGGLFPVRLDVGFPLLDRRCTAYVEGGECEREEPSQIHFGLLYSF